MYKVDIIDQWSQQLWSGNGYWQAGFHCLGERWGAFSLQI